MADQVRQVARFRPAGGADFANRHLAPTPRRQCREAAAAERSDGVEISKSRKAAVCGFDRAARGCWHAWRPVTGPGVIG
jgi:hypothetical protein